MQDAIDIEIWQSWLEPASEADLEEQKKNRRASNCCGHLKISAYKQGGLEIPKQPLIARPQIFRQPSNYMTGRDSQLLPLVVISCIQCSRLLEQIEHQE